MKFFSASFTSIIIRFYLMMACVIVGLLVGPIWLAPLALPLFLSALLGPAFVGGKVRSQEKNYNPVMPMTNVRNLVS